MFYLGVERVEDVLVAVEIRHAVFVHQFCLVSVFLHTEHLETQKTQLLDRSNAQVLEK